MPGSGIWECKIGEADAAKLPDGCDAPMRAAFVKLTGEEPEYIFSGWGASLTEGESAVLTHYREAPPEPEPVHEDGVPPVRVVTDAIPG